MVPAAWDIDLETGHMAHPSGLHAYIVDTPELSSNAIQCIGPFSSHVRKLRKRDVLEYTADAILELEALECFSGMFTYWGSLGRRSEQLQNTVNVMEHEFGLIPNPSFRSNVLINSGRAKQAPSSLLLEWSHRDNLTGINHRLGTHFTFPLNGRNRIRICGKIDKVAEDLRSLEPSFRSTTVKLLGSLAVAVLTEFGADFSNSFLRRLELRAVEDQF